MAQKQHITRDVLVAHASGDLAANESARMMEHLGSCEECSRQAESLRDFTASLDADWNARRLEELGMAHPSSADLEDYWTDEAEPGVAASIRDHVSTCEVCSDHMKRLDEGFAALNAADPLAGPRWSATVRRKFAAGIEMVVEAAHGAFTSAAGLVREVMTPQATARLAATPTVAMGRKPVDLSSVEWHDATFQTDEVSGEITGSTDNSTGRGVVTVVVYKSGGYMGSPPTLDLVNSAGDVIATQSALDMGDRYSANFSGLDEGHYLVGIREPGG